MTDITPESLRALARYDISDPNHVNLPAEARDVLRAAADEIERLKAIVPNGQRAVYAMPPGLVEELKRASTEKPE